MFDPKFIDNMANRLVDVIPSGLLDIKQDLAKNFHGILQATLGQLDLVTREEFEVQKAVLAKVYSKVAALEKRVIYIEQQLNKQELNKEALNKEELSKQELNKKRPDLNK